MSELLKILKKYDVPDLFEAVKKTIEERFEDGSLSPHINVNDQLNSYSSCPSEIDALIVLRALQDYNYD